DVVARLLALSRSAIFLAAAACLSAASAVNHGAVMLRHTEVLERVALSAARKEIHLRSATNFSSAPRLASERAISAFRPPMPSPQRRPSIASSTQSSEGVLMVSPLKIASENLPPEVRRKSFGSGHGGE